MSHDTPNPNPAPPLGNWAYEPGEWPEKNEDEWLAEMAQWSSDKILSVVNDDHAPSAAKLAAHQRKLAADGGITSSGVPVCGPAFERVVNRSLGKPEDTPKVNIEQVQVLNVGTSHLLDTIERYLTADQPTDRAVPFELRSLDALPAHTGPDPEDPAGESPDPAGDAAGGPGQPDGTE